MNVATALRIIGRRLADAGGDAMYASLRVRHVALDHWNATIMPRHEPTPPVVATGETMPRALASLAERLLPESTAERLLVLVACGLVGFGVHDDDDGNVLSYPAGVRLLSRAMPETVRLFASITDDPGELLVRYEPHNANTRLGKLDPLTGRVKWDAAFAADHNVTATIDRLLADAASEGWCCDGSENE